MSVEEAPFAKALADLAGAAEAPDAAPKDRLEGPRNIDAILRIPVDVQVVLGSATMPVANLIKLGRGAIIPLDHRVGEPVDVVVNGRIVARGEVVVVEDDNSRFGVSLTEIVGPAGPDQNS
jgi:flagellar motor switch protein FliN/FliY